jgi:fibronectin-binding autotransporter adhesin
MKTLPTLRRYRQGLALMMTGLMFVSSLPVRSYAQVTTGSWNLNANGDWTDPANWLDNLVPNGVGHVARFRNDITANRVINFNDTVTLGGLELGDALGGQTFTFTGTNVTFDNGESNAFIRKFGSATDVWQAPLFLASGLNTAIHAGTLDFSGSGNSQIYMAGTGNLIKTGAGQLRVNAFLGDYGGNFVVGLGTLNIGGGDSSNPSLGIGTGGITLLGSGSTDRTFLRLSNNGAASDSEIVYMGNNNVNLQGAANIAVDRNFFGAANIRNTMVLNDLNFGGGELRMVGANEYALRFAGTTTLGGQTNVFFPNTPISPLTLSGPIVDAGGNRSLTKEGTGRLVVSNTANTYGGMTAVKNGVLQLKDGANLGAGPTFLNGGALTPENATTLAGVASNGLILVGQLGTSRYALPVIGFAQSFGNLDSGNPLNVNIPIAGMALAIDGGETNTVVSSNIDLSAIAGGSNRVWISNAQGLDRTYQGLISPAPDGNIRLTSGGNTLIISGQNDRLGGPASPANLVFGYDHSTPVNFGGATVIQGQGGTVSVRVNNSFAGDVTIHRGLTVNINGTGFFDGLDNEVASPLGSGVVTLLGGTLSTDNTSNARFNNTDFRLFGGSTILLDNSNVLAPNANRRLLPTANVALSSSTLRLIGHGAASVASSQAINNLNYRGGSTLSIDTNGTTAGRVTTLSTESLERLDRGTLMIRNIANTATTFGTLTGTQKLLVTGTAPTVTNGMVGADIAFWGGTASNDQSLPLFATYDPVHGFQPAAFTAAGTAALLAGAPNTQITDISGVALGVTGSPSVQALRIRSTVNNQTVTGGTITIGAAADPGQGAGLFLAHTANNTITHTSNFAFGSQEGLIYGATTGGGSGVINLSGVLSGTNGITRFGNGIVQLSGANTFSGPLTLHGGETRLSNISSAGGSPGTPGEIHMYGGGLQLAATGRYNANLTVFDNARLGNVNVGSTGLNNVTIAPRTGSDAPTVFWVQANGGGQATNIFGDLNLNNNVQINMVHPIQLNGAMTGTGNLEKYFNERLIFTGDSSGYNGSLTSYISSFVSLNSASAAKPFGTGPIVINPGGGITLAAPTNIAPGQVTINSDHGGTSYIGQLYVADPATTLPAFTSNATGPRNTAFAIGAVGFNVDIDQSTLFGGNTYLGGAQGYTGIFTGNLTPSARGYLLGTAQGTLRVAKPLTGNFNAILGASMTGEGSRLDLTVNNSGGSVFYDVPMTYTGTTTLNPGIILRIANQNALVGTGDLILAGGQLRAESSTGQNRMINPINITNNVVMTADSSIQMENSAYALRIGGNIALAPGSNGVVRTLSVNVDQPGGAQNNAGMVYLDGGISDGAGGSGNHFVKGGPGTLFFTGPNTYTGSTTIAGGLIGINTDADWGQTSLINMVNGGIAVWENSFTTARDYHVTGSNGYFDIAGGLTLTQAPTSVIDGFNFLIKRGLGTMILQGDNAVTGIYVGDGVLQVNSQAALGNPAEGGTDRIQFSNDQTIGGATSGTRYSGGTLRINFTGDTNRGIVFSNTGNTGFSGGIDVTSGNVFTARGVISQGTELDFAFKTGLGTLVTTATNTYRGLAMTNGVLQFANNAPWANSTGTAADNTFIEMLGGTIRAVNTGANITLANAASTTTYNYGGGMTLSMASGGAFSFEFNADNLIRQNQGTLIIQTEGATTLGGVGGSNTGRLIATNVVNAGLTRASAVTNGIFPAHLVGANPAGEAFFLANDAATGFVPYAGPFNTSLLGIAPTGIGQVTSAETLTGLNSIYAFSTSADISGGTLTLTAIDNLRSGGILINGSNTISSNLIFSPLSATAAGVGTPGEALIFTKAGESASLTGTITANAFTKFGPGELVLAGNTSVFGDVSVQAGTLKVGSANTFTRMNSELNINAGATLDLNGFDVAFETIGANNRQVAGANVGGAITNTSATTATLMVAGPLASTFNGTINLNTRLVKAGAGVLTINGYSSATPDGGNNTFTGGTDIYGVGTVGGINLNNTTFGLGGFGGTNPEVNLYGGTLGFLFSNASTGVNGTQGQQFNNQVVRFGADGTQGLTLNVRGPALINVNQAATVGGSAFGQGNIMTVGAMNLSNATLTFTGGNLYKFRADGPITIQGSQAAFQTNSDGPSGTPELFGVISGNGALTKLGDGQSRALVIANPNNTFSGGTNIIAGDVQVLATSGSALGTGAVRVFPDGSLRIAGAGSINPDNLTVMSRAGAMGAVVLDNQFVPSLLNSTNFSSVYNTALQLAQPYWSTDLNMASIGDGRAFLGTGFNGEVTYNAATLGAGVPDAWNPDAGVYRIAPGSSSFAFSGVNNVLTGLNYLQLGPQRQNSFGVTNGANVLVIRNANDFSGGTQITRGAGLYIETGGRATGETPLGTGAIEVYGELRIRGAQGSMFNASTGTHYNDIIMRPGGVLRLHDADGLVATPFIGAGEQGRWADNIGIDLNGGTFILHGAANFTTVETIGDVIARKAGGLQVFRNTTASAVQLNVGDISRADRGVLTLGYNNGFLGLPATTPLSYERITAQTIGGAAIALNGTTNNGAGVVNGGMVVPWIVDRTANTFLGYNPTGAGTGFQPLLGVASPGAGQLAYSQVITGGAFGTGVAATDIIDLTTAAKTLNANPTVHALRSNQNLSPTASFNTVTINSGGLILTGGTINPTGVLAQNLVAPMTLNFGPTGTDEAFIFVGAATSAIQAQINAAGLTKFGPNQLNILSINPGITDTVVVNEGTLYVRVPIAGGGSGAPVSQALNGQDVVLNGGAPWCWNPSWPMLMALPLNWLPMPVPPACLTAISM